MLYELILINEIEQRAKIIFLSVANRLKQTKNTKQTVCDSIRGVSPSSMLATDSSVCYVALRAAPHGTVAIHTYTSTSHLFHCHMTSGDTIHL